MNELTYCVIVEWAGQGTLLDQETFATVTNSRVPFKNEEDYALAE